MKDWEYAVLTHDVAEAGGVDAFCDALKQEGVLEGLANGRIQGIVGTVGCAGTLALIGYVVKTQYSKYKEKRLAVRKNAEKARSQLKDQLDEDHMQNDDEKKK